MQPALVAARRTDIHRRIGGVGIGLALFLIAILAYDLITRGRVHPATLWGGAFLVALQVGRIVLGGNETWQAFARWFVS